MKLSNITSKLPKVNTASITKGIGKATIVAKKHSPLALTIVGGVGMLATAYFAYKAQPKIAAIVDDMETKQAQIERYQELKQIGHNRLEEFEYVELRDFEQQDMHFDRLHYIRQIAGAVALPTFTALGSITAIAVSYKIMSGRVGVLSSVVSALTADKAKRDERMLAMVDQGKLTEEQRTQIAGPNTNAVQAEVIGKKGKKQLVEGVEKAETNPLTGIWFSDSDEFVKDDHDYNITWIKHAEGKLERLLMLRGNLLMNQVYDELGIERTKEGALMGWSTGDGFGFGVDVVNTMSPQGDFYPEIFVKWSTPRYIYEDVDFDGRYSIHGNY